MTSDVHPAAGINCIVQPLDALQGRINGFIRERRSFPGSLSPIGGELANKPCAARRSQCSRQAGIEYDWGHS